MRTEPFWSLTPSRRVCARPVLSRWSTPGFEDAEVPDIESWSKALNAGQYPLSVLGLSEEAAELYRYGIYGNTMTTNPRALDVACAVLDGVTPALRRNIRDRGVEFVEKLTALSERYPEIVDSVQGSGLLFCAELHEHIPSWVWERSRSVSPARTR